MEVVVQQQPPVDLASQGVEVECQLPQAVVVVPLPLQAVEVEAGWL